MTTQTAAETLEVAIPVGTHVLPGTLTLPDPALGLVLFAHGSGSSRHSPRNRHVAAVLHGRQVGTLLFDLLTEPEGAAQENVFDIGLLAERLLAATRWAMSGGRTFSLPIGLFGASTGAGAALVAAARERQVRAVVSRGGRPDLATDSLAEVRAPTLLIVGARDPAVVRLNREAYARLRCTKHLAIVPGATHLFEEAGTLEHAANLAADWFVEHLRQEHGP